MGWPGRYINVRLLLMAVYGPSAPKRPLGTIRKDEGFSSRVRGFISLEHDLNNVESNVKTPFLPSLWSIEFSTLLKYSALRTRDPVDVSSNPLTKTETQELALAE